MTKFVVKKIDRAGRRELDSSPEPTADGDVT